jgi:hypothetical protein
LLIAISASASAQWLNYSPPAFRRQNHGMIEIELIVDDPKAYTKPWTVPVYQRLMLDTDLIEFVCQQN